MEKPIMVLGVSLIVASIIVALAMLGAAGQISSSIAGLSSGAAIQGGLGANTGAPTPAPTVIAAAPSTTPTTAAPSAPTTPSKFDLSQIANAPSEGNANATVDFIEFGDFQCPFCAEYFSSTEPQIVQNYVDTGKVRYVWMNFPLTQIHPNAQPAADAAMCVFHLAGNAAFWKFHDLDYQNNNEVNVGSAINTSIFAGWAAQAGANPTQYASCISANTYDSQVMSDEQVGVTYGVGGTPSFEIVNVATGQATQVVGAQPYSVFQSALDSAVSQA